MRPIVRDNTGSMKSGQDLIIAGYVGLAGTTAIAAARKEELRSWFTEEYINCIQNNEVVELNGNLEHWTGFGATECEMIGEGGVMAALWNLSGAYGVGIEFALRQIPVKQETIEICERYDLNPYRLMSKNCLLLVADHGSDLVNILERQNIHAAVIGKVNQGIKREIDNGYGRGFLDRPTRDELRKIIN